MGARQNLEVFEEGPSISCGVTWPPKRCCVWARGQTAALLAMVADDIFEVNRIVAALDV
jgi:hypothetical protein